MLAGADGEAVYAGCRNEEEVSLAGLLAVCTTPTEYPTPFQNDVFRYREDPVLEPGSQHAVEPESDFGLEHRSGPAFGVVPQRRDCGRAYE